MHTENDRAVRDTLNRVGDRWTIYVVRALGGAPRRFNQLKRELKGISARMLTLTLKKLERDGMVVRSETHTNSLRIEYGLTPLGTTFLAPIAALVAWAGEHAGAIEAARERHDSGLGGGRSALPAPSADTRAGDAEGDGSGGRFL